MFKWTDSINNKLAAALWLFIVLAILFLNNLRERKNAGRIGDTIATIYDDRLVVEGYIFQYAAYLHQIRVVLDDTAASTHQKELMIVPLSMKIQELNYAYGKTILTKDEEIAFGELVAYSHRMDQLFTSGELETGKHVVGQATAILDTLSKIQIVEAKEQVANAEKLLKSDHLSSTLEMAVLLVVALIIQALIISSKPIRVKRFPKDPNLN